MFPWTCIPNTYVFLLSHWTTKSMHHHPTNWKLSSEVMSLECLVTKKVLGGTGHKRKESTLLPPSKFSFSFLVLSALHLVYKILPVSVSSPCPLQFHFSFVSNREIPGSFSLLYSSNTTFSLVLHLFLVLWSSFSIDSYRIHNWVSIFPLDSQYSYL